MTESSQTESGVPDDATSAAVTDRTLALFENLPSPVALVDRDGRIEAFNPAWRRLFGLVGRSDAAAPAQNEPDATHHWLAPEIDRFLAGGERDEVVEKEAQAAGGRRHFAVRFRRLADAGGGLAACLIALDDLTRQKESEAALKETTLWMKEMFNALEEAVFIGTPGGRIVNANRAAQKIFGYTAAELKHQTTEMLHVDRNHFETFTDRVRDGLAAGDEISLEYLAKRKDGEVFPVMITITLLKREDATPLGLVSIVRDISALKEAEAATRNSERLQGALELAGAVCHDLNQPLMAITGYAELVLLDCPEEAPHFSKLNKIVEQVKKLGDITQKLMRVTRYETKAYGDQKIIDIEKASGS